MRWNDWDCVASSRLVREADRIWLIRNVVSPIGAKRYSGRTYIVKHYLDGQRIYLEELKDGALSQADPEVYRPDDWSHWWLLQHGVSAVFAPTATLGSQGRGGSLYRSDRQEVTNPSDSANSSFGRALKCGFAGH